MISYIINEVIDILIFLGVLVTSWHILNMIPPDEPGCQYSIGQKVKHGVLIVSGLGIWFLLPTLMNSINY